MEAWKGGPFKPVVYGKGRAILSLYLCLRVKVSGTEVRAGRRGREIRRGTRVPTLTSETEIHGRAIARLRLALGHQRGPTQSLQLVGARNCCGGSGDFAHVLPSKRRGGCALARARRLGAPPGSSRTCQGAGRRGACFGSVSFDSEGRNERDSQLAELGE